MTTAEELLCSRKWRLARGAWMLFGWFPFAFTAWIGYMIIGVKSRNWKWIALSVAFFVFGTAVISVMSWVGGETNVQKGEALPEPYATYSSIAMWSSLIVWLGNAAGLQWWINRKWLIWRAHNDKKVSTPWYATATASGQPPAHADPQRVSTVLAATLANGSGTSAPGTPPARQAPPAPLAPPVPLTPPVMTPSSPVPPVTTTPASLDINTATQDELAMLPGFDAAIAAQVVAVRSQSGGFGDASELVSRAGVKPHVLAGVLGRITLSARSGHAQSSAASNDTQTSRNGRRLEF